MISMASKKLIQAVAVTAELMGNEMSDMAAKVLCDDLATFPENLVIEALQRVRRECKGRLAINDVIMRIDDGRPGVEEAWAMCPVDDGSSVVWTQEMSDAFYAALPLIEAGDQIAARMAFKEVYSEKLVKARNSGVKPEWWASLGHDESTREAVVRDAVSKGRICIGMGVDLCPSLMDEGNVKPLQVDTRFLKKI